MAIQVESRLRGFLSLPRKTTVVTVDPPHPFIVTARRSLPLSPAQKTDELAELLVHVLMAGQ